MRLQGVPAPNLEWVNFRLPLLGGVHRILVWGEEEGGGRGCHIRNDAGGSRNDDDIGQ